MSRSHEIRHDLVDAQTGQVLTTFTGQVPRVGDRVEVYVQAAQRDETRQVVAVTWAMAGMGDSHAKVTLGARVA